MTTLINTLTNVLDPLFAQAHNNGVWRGTGNSILASGIPFKDSPYYRKLQIQTLHEHKQRYLNGYNANHSIAVNCRQKSTYLIADMHRSYKPLHHLITQSNRWNTTGYIRTDYEEAYQRLTKYTEETFTKEQWHALTDDEMMQKGYHLATEIYDNAGIVDHLGLPIATRMLYADAIFIATLHTFIPAIIQQTKISLEEG